MGSNVSKDSFTIVSLDFNGGYFNMLPQIFKYSRDYQPKGEEHIWIEKIR